MAEEFVAARPSRPPTHPGALLRDEILPVIGVSITAAADHLRVTRQHLHRLLAEETGVSSEMALRLGKFCGNGPRLWLRMQESFDLWHAERKLGSVVEQIPNMGPSASAEAACAGRPCVHAHVISTRPRDTDEGAGP